MIRKKIVTLALAVVACILAAWGQDANAGWYKYPVFADRIDDMVATKDKVYYLSGGNLFSYSTEDDESYAYTHLNDLTGLQISKIFYNYDDKCLAVVYDDSNIDLLFDDGDMVNLPEIRDAQLSASKDINSVSFGEGRMVVACAFGVVVYSMDRHEVIESGIYNENVEYAAAIDGRLLICLKVDGQRKMFASPIDIRHNSLDKFEMLYPGAYFHEIIPAGENRFISRSRMDQTLRLCAFDFSARSWTELAHCDVPVSAAPRQYPGGFYAYNDSTLVFLSADGEFSSRSIPKAVRGQKYALHNKADIIWTGDADGIAQADISGQKPTILYDKMVHPGTTTVANVGFMRWSPDGQRLYVSNLGVSNIRSAAPGERVDYQTTNIIEDGHPRDASLMVASADHPAIKKIQERTGSTRMWGDPTWIAEDPDNQDIYYCANNHEGLYVIKRNASTGKYEEYGKFTLDNSPAFDNWGIRANDVNIDQQGNLWMGFRGGSAYAMLPADKRRANPSAIKKSDWKEYTQLKSFEMLQPDMASLFCKKSPVAFFINGKYGFGIAGSYVGSSLADTSDDQAFRVASFTDQDGNVFTFSYATSLLEDNRGAVWVGTTSGIFEITNPTTLAANTTSAVRRPKVARNDGTNYADYLLGTDIVTAMALDPAGRKWVATDNSGIYLVNETGSEIIKHFTTANSPLPSNTVNAIECDPMSNTVYVGTPYGLYSFLSDASPAAESYSEILAYPNPVRPEYSGPVTITGLMENSIVKIADQAGNVIYQTRSEGGMATWDLTGLGGRPVRSGIYYIYATTGGDGSPTHGATSKIAVIR